MGAHMDDKQIVARISELAAEEQRLEEAHVGEGLSDEEQARRPRLEVTPRRDVGPPAPAPRQAQRGAGPRRGDPAVCRHGRGLPAVTPPGRLQEGRPMGPIPPASHFPPPHRSNVRAGGPLKNYKPTGG